MTKKCCIYVYHGFWAGQGLLLIREAGDRLNFGVDEASPMKKKPRRKINGDVVIMHLNTSLRVVVCGWGVYLASPQPQPFLQLALVTMFNADISVSSLLMAFPPHPQRESLLFILFNKTLRPISLINGSFYICGETVSLILESRILPFRHIYTVLFRLLILFTFNSTGYLKWLKTYGLVSGRK
jgi:hypothetical protein